MHIGSRHILYYVLIERRIFRTLFPVAGKYKFFYTGKAVLYFVYTAYKRRTENKHVAL